MLLSCMFFLRAVGLQWRRGVLASVPAPALVLLSLCPLPYVGEGWRRGRLSALLRRHQLFQLFQVVCIWV